MICVYNQIVVFKEITFTKEIVLFVGLIIKN